MVEGNLNFSIFMSEFSFLAELLLAFEACLGLRGYLAVLMKLYVSVQ